MLVYFFGETMNTIGQKKFDIWMTGHGIRGRNLSDFKKTCGYEAVWWDGNRPRYKDNFSRLINDIVVHSKHEYIIIGSYKTRPKKEDINLALFLLEQGYAFVGLRRFSFFAVNKEVFRKIGLLDQRYIGGGFEDIDFYLRMREADMAIYIDDIVDIVTVPSTWSYDTNIETPQLRHFKTKWSFTGNWPGEKGDYTYKRALEEEVYEYFDLRESTGAEFLTYDKSHFKTHSDAASIWRYKMEDGYDI
jgi:hypothetical protein